MTPATLARPFYHNLNFFDNEHIMGGRKRELSDLSSILAEKGIVQLIGEAKAGKTLIIDLFRYAPKHDKATFFL